MSGVSPERGCESVLLLLGLLFGIAVPAVLSFVLLEARLFVVFLFLGIVGVFVWPFERLLFSRSLSMSVMEKAGEKRGVKKKTKTKRKVFGRG